MVAEMNRFREMWETQRENLRLGEQAEMNNLCLEFNGVVKNLDDPVEQKKLRRYAWQIVEEVSEVLAAPPDKLDEEVADVLCFLVDLSILAKIELDGGPIDILDHLIRRSQGGDLYLLWGKFVNALGMTMNELKNRPWRVERRPTNQEAFRTKMYDLFVKFADGCNALGINAEALYVAHAKKTEVIRERLRHPTAIPVYQQGHDVNVKDIVQQLREESDEHFQ